MEQMTYKGSGVDYDAMDPFKRMCQVAGLETAENLKRFGIKEYEQSRGESAYLIEFADFFLAQVEEGLGTKSLVADAMNSKQLVSEISEIVRTRTGKSFYKAISQCTIAMIVNDLITLGALPLSVAMHLAVGDSKWFDDTERVNDLVEGWKNACMISRCAWGGGETPTLRDIIYPNTCVLSGSAVGIIRDKKNLINGSRIESGDQILLFTSSGVHANGLTMARKIAENLPEGYLTRWIRGGKTFGELLLAPTVIYVPLVDDCQKVGIDLHYAVHITGHGWRKLMRAKESFTYVITNLPTKTMSPVFDFIQENGNVTDEEMYGTYNMGAGFALYVPKSEVPRIFDLCAAGDYREKYGIEVSIGGYIEKGQDKKVVIQPKNLTFEADTLAVR